VIEEGKRGLATHKSTRHALPTTEEKEKASFLQKKLNSPEQFQEKKSCRKGATPPRGENPSP